jgi:hypothetical protein
MGTQAEVDLSHGHAFARRTASVNGAATIYEVYLEAYDFYPTQTDLLGNLPSKVSDRLLFPIDYGVAALEFSRDSADFQAIGPLVLAPFGYITTPQSPSSIRKFRLRTCHYDENVSPPFAIRLCASTLICSFLGFFVLAEFAVLLFLSIPAHSLLAYTLQFVKQSGQPDHLEVFFDVPGAPTFSLAPIASGGDYACTYTDFFQFGSGSESEIPLNHANVYVRFVSAAAYNNHAALYYLAIEAHDFPISPTAPPTVLAQRFVGERLLFPLTTADGPLRQSVWVGLC